MSQRAAEGARARSVKRSSAITSDCAAAAWVATKKSLISSVCLSWASLMSGGFEFEANPALFRKELRTGDG